MILSMTGYGKATVTHNEKKIHVEIKTLNSKTLDLSTRIAPLYREREMEMRQLLSKTIERGKVEFSIWIEKETGTDATPINAPLVTHYYLQLKELAAQTGIPEPQDWMNLLLKMPEVMTRPDNEQLEEAEWAAAQSAINAALQQLVAFREQEGRALYRKFTEKIENISRLLESIEPYEKMRVEKIKTRILESLKAMPEADYDRNRLEQELIYYIEKLDINEEKQRLSNHLKYFAATMNDGHAQGKKLGFIAQEMGREINTTGSKSNQAEMQNIVVRMKDELEQIKEQVLNVL